MKRTTWTVLSVAVLVIGVSTLLALRHYRIQPLVLPVEESGKLVYEAHNPRCPDPVEMGLRPVILKPAGDQQSIVLGPSEEIAAAELEARLKRIFATRGGRIVYVVEAAAAKPPYRSAFLRRLLSSEFVDQVCVVDPANPPKWYPPPIIEYH